MEVKLTRLFGFEVISDTVGEKRLKGFEDGDRSVESFGEENGIGKSLDKASYEMDKTAKEKISRHELEHKKYECQFCPKEFRNPQAFGGHQNARKKERLKRRRMQLQEKSNSCNFYLDPSQAQNNPVYRNSLPWFDASSSYVPDFMLNGESFISFNLSHQSQSLCYHTSYVSNLLHVLQICKQDTSNRSLLSGLLLHIFPRTAIRAPKNTDT
ncbi:hypothetical protein P3X46_023346 [Hevea brasiliensis]|uniref:C2H2-type domain-containing protein n=1 Tax=Hevea brasiliensis TaxID=3981 RepID=A0ABQ9LEC2_HEVBR|nr:zinc finger protein 8-like [Hevea brasiliensis]KAJ9163707.1 hypothetical protein P3X46_023346 [Hevea brasiliensis]